MVSIGLDGRILSKPATITALGPKQAFLADLFYFMSCSCPSLDPGGLWVLSGILVPCLPCDVMFVATRGSISRVTAAVIASIRLASIWK